MCLVPLTVLLTLAVSPHLTVAPTPGTQRFEGSEGIAQRAISYQGIDINSLIFSVSLLHPPSPSVEHNVSSSLLFLFMRQSYRK